MWNPFLYRNRIYPIKLLVDIHSHCNARCTMCPYPKYSRTQSQGTMQWPLYQKITDEFARLGRKYNFNPTMSYCYMGEPFLADDLDRYVQYAQARNIQVYLNTNASAMTPEKIDALLATGFTGRIHISFHGITPETYQRITGLDYNTTLDNIRYLLENTTFDHSSVTIRGVDDNWPKGEKEKWLNYWKPTGVQIEYLPPISRCGALKRLARDKKKNEKVKRYGCEYHLPLVEMVILYDGRAVMCCQDMGREIIWGNVEKNGILGVWNSPTRKNLIESLYTAKPMPNSFLCARCEQALTATGLIKSTLKAATKKLTPKNAAAL